MPNSPRVYRNSEGFTLLEVIIALALLAFISVGVYQATVSSFQLNFKLGNESADYTSIMMSIQAIENDISQIYISPVSVAEKKDQLEQPTTYWSAMLRSDGYRRTRLKGDKEKLTFISNGNRRLERDAPQSDFQKVFYEVERNNSGAYSLYRTTDWNAFQLTDEQKGKKPPRIALIDNLSSAKFGYYRKSTTTWEDQWDSEGPYTKPEERYPELISLKIEVPNPTNNANQQAWEIVIRPNVQVNDPTKASGGAPGLPGAPDPNTGRPPPL